MAGLKVGNYTWEKVDSHDKKYVCHINNKFSAMTWEFGSIHQCKVFIKYTHKIDGKEYTAPGFEDQVGIGLTPGKTRDEAMIRAIDWIETFKRKGILSSNKLFKKCQKNYPELFPNRNSILEHLFFVIGNGYDWLDGCLIELNPSDHLEFKAATKELNEFQEIIDRAKNSGREARRLLGLPEAEEEEDTLKSYRDKVWKGDKLPFYPVSKNYSNICCVPDDVQTHWLKIAYEAAILLRDKSGVPDITSKHNEYDKDDVKRQEENQKIGADIVAELERRFPNVKKV